MKKKIFLILINIFIYTICSILYASKGFALMLAENSEKAHAVYDKYGKSYSYLYFKPISKILYRVGFLGIIATGIILIVLLTYVTYSEIKRLNEDSDLNKKNSIKKYGAIILIVVMYMFVLYAIPRILENSFFSDVGREGIVFDLF